MPHSRKENGMEETKEKRSEVFIRSDGWVFSADGMKRLKAGGQKGFDRFKANIEAKIGKWHRVSKPLDVEAAKAVKEVKGMIPRAVFVSSAIMAEAERRGKNPPSYSELEKNTKATRERGEFMRLTLTDDAYRTIRPLPNAAFREFVSEAILRAAMKPYSVLSAAKKRV